MHRRPLSIAAACLALFMTTTGAAAQVPTAGAPGQVPQHVATPQDVLSMGTITVHVLGPDNRPLKQQAFVSLYKMGSGVPLGTVPTERSPGAVFSDMPGFGRYTVAVSSRGYGTESKDFDYDSSYAPVQVDITKHLLFRLRRYINPGIGAAAQWAEARAESARCNAGGKTPRGAKGAHRSVQRGAEKRRCLLLAGRSLSEKQGLPACPNVSRDNHFD